MLKILLFGLSLQTIILACSSNYLFVDKQKCAIQIEWINEDIMDEEEETVFYRGFWQAYASNSAEEMGLKDKTQFLKDVFAQVRAQCSFGTNILVRAMDKGRCVGFVSFKKMIKPDQIYVDQLAVDPDYWGRGIGRELLFSIFKRYPSTNALFMDYRKLNHAAAAFSRACGFKPSNYLYPGLDPTRYRGVEWHAP